MSARSSFARAALALAASVVVPAAASAALVPYYFSSTVNQLGPGSAPAGYESVQMGDRFILSFNLDTGALDSEWRGWWGVYPAAAKDITLDVPARGIHANLGSTAFTTYNGTTQFQEDELRFDIGVAPGATFIFWLRANSPDGSTPPAVMTNDLMPGEIRPEQWNYTNFAGMYGPDPYRPTIFGGPMTLVPEPASIACAALAVAPLVIGRRRRGR